MRRGRHLAGVVLVALAIAAAASAAGRDAAATPRGWHTLLTAQAQGVFPLGWASGRAWFVVEGAKGDMVLESARVGGGA